MTYLLSCRAVQDPFEIGLDDNGRTMFSCNYDIVSQQTSNNDIEQEIINKIITVSIITGLTLTQCYKGLDQSFEKPTESESITIPLVRIISTGGYAPGLLRASGTTRMKRKPSVQIITASMTREVARLGAVAIFNYLCSINSVDI